MKLIEILSSLKPSEFKELKLFLQSPYFNSDPNLIKLYEAISKQFSSLDSFNHLDKNNLFSQVFPEYEWNDGKWRNLTSKMVKALEHYLVVLEIKQDTELKRKKLLANAFGRRNLYSFYLKEVESLNDGLENKSFVDHEALLYRMEISQNLYYHPLTNKKNNIHWLNSAKKDAEVFFHALQLKMECEEMVYGKISKEQNESKASDPPPFIYYRLYQLVHSFLEDGKHDSFLTTKTYFESVVEKLSRSDKKFGLMNLLNFAINKNNLGQDYNQIMFELYEQGLEQRILLENGLLTETTFNNIITISAFLKKYEWAENFIEKYEKYLQEDIRIEAKTMGLADLYFRQDDFSKVIDLLVQFTPKDMLRLFIAKSILLRAYFDYFLKDRTYYEVFKNFSHSFENQIKRKGSLPEERKVGCINLSRTLRKITKLILENKWNNETQSSFLNLVENMHPLIGKPWLIEKLKKM